MRERLSFGAWLKQLRQKQGLTQDRLAELTGCATQTIRKIEGGQRRPSFHMAERLAQVVQLAQADYESWMAVAREMAAPEAEPSALVESSCELLAFPSYLMPFIGRERESHDLVKLLRADDCRLICLLGPGGIGKTRLAVEVAKELDTFPDGIVFVSLASIQVPSLIATSIANLLGIPLGVAANPTGQLLAYLRERSILLILDNIEHLLHADNEAVSLIERILSEAPRLKMLVTSRERLPLASTWVMEISGLDLPSAERLKQGQNLSALTLFSEHAQRIERGFQLSPKNQQLVATICRLVDGMPLGIELAAGWVRILSLEEIAKELLRSLHNQHLSARTLPERHRSLHDVVDYSWQLLSESERHVLSQLAVFRGGFERAAAEYVAQATLTILAQLIDKSLVRRQQNGRYELHEVIRQYAAARLAEHPDQHARAYQRHAAYYAHWLKERAEPLKSSHQFRIRDQISSELDNIRSMWDWAISHGEIGYFRDSGEALQWFCEFHLHLQEGERWFCEAIEVLQSRRDGQTDQAVGEIYAQLLWHYSHITSRLGNFEQAYTAARESSQLLASSPNQTLRSQVEITLGLIAFQLGRYHQADLSLHRAKTYLMADDHWNHALCHTCLSLYYQSQMRFSEAEHAFRSALDSYRKLATPRGMVFCVSFCSPVLIALGAHQEAQMLLRECLVIAGKANDSYGIAISMLYLSQVALEDHAYEEAFYLLHESIVLMRKLGIDWELTQALNCYAHVCVRTEQLDHAHAAYYESYQIAIKHHVLPNAFEALLGLADCCQARQQDEQALLFSLVVLGHAASSKALQLRAADLQATLQHKLPQQTYAALQAKSKLISLQHLADRLF